MRNFPPQKKLYYDPRNIIDMAEYVSHLAEVFQTAQDKGFPSVCRKRSLSGLMATTRDDYIEIDTVIDEIATVAMKVTSSKTQSPIADHYLFNTAARLRAMPQKDDSRIAFLLSFERK
ncbi:MAG: hypothetical protein AUJ12_09820 [Alphaproteobacteria bacterium CG1_02_46_17]|nr:MAG: hypothetical protein AUJ12_09820 [Alphaproteobacteria bacterium CG1_02_46_17]